MVSSNATTVADYLQELPGDRRGTIEDMRAFILKHLPNGYEETMNWGMISYEIPLKVFADTYNKQPLSYVGLAAQKHYNSLYLMSIYTVGKQLENLLAAYEKAGIKPKMGKSCLNFKKLDELPMDAIGEIIAGTTPATYIELYQQARKK